MAIHTVGEISYHVNNRLLKHWKIHSLEYMHKKNQDRVYVVDGMERSGKSWWAMQQAGVLDPKMFSSVDEFLKRVCYTPDEFFHAVRTIRNGVIIFDEAFRGFSSRASISKVNKKLVSALMEMGQNNNIVFIVLPRIFLLDMYPAMLRSNGLFNIYIDKKGGKRVWRGFNYEDKNYIYQQGAKKGWKYPIRTFFRGNFYNKFPGGQVFEDAYIKKKRSALVEMDKESNKKEEDHKWLQQRDRMVYERYKTGNSIQSDGKIGKLSHMKLSKALKAEGIEICATEVRNSCQKSMEIDRKASERAEN